MSVSGLMALKGKVIGTVYGPCVVLGLVEKEGITYIHLKEEAGGEEYVVDLAQIGDLIGAK